MHTPTAMKLYNSSSFCLCYCTSTIIVLLERQGRFVMHVVVINVNSRENPAKLALRYCTRSMVSQVVTVDIPSILVLF